MIYNSVLIYIFELKAIFGNLLNLYNLLYNFTISVFFTSIIRCIKYIYLYSYLTQDCTITNVTQIVQLIGLSHDLYTTFSCNRCFQRTRNRSSRIDKLNWVWRLWYAGNKPKQHTTHTVSLHNTRAREVLRVANLSRLPASYQQVISGERQYFRWNTVYILHRGPL